MPKTVNLSALSEEQLLYKLKDYIYSMYKFTSATRNVHKEIKDSFANTLKIFNQYYRFRANGSQMGDRDRTTSAQRSLELTSQKYERRGTAVYS
jgi:hypothetical protein